MQTFALRMKHHQSTAFEMKNFLERCWMFLGCPILFPLVFPIGFIGLPIYLVYSNVNYSECSTSEYQKIAELQEGDPAIRAIVLSYARDDGIIQKWEYRAIIDKKWELYHAKQRSKVINPKKGELELE